VPSAALIGGSQTAGLGSRLHGTPPWLQTRPLVGGQAFPVRMPRVFWASDRSYRICAVDPSSKSGGHQNQAGGQSDRRL